MPNSQTSPLLPHEAVTSPATPMAVPTLHALPTTALSHAAFVDLADDAERRLRHLSNSALWLWPLPLPGIAVACALFTGWGTGSSTFVWVASGIALTVVWFAVLCVHALWLRPRRAKAVLREALRQRHMSVDVVERVVSAYGTAAVRGQLSDPTWMRAALDDAAPAAPPCSE